MIGNLIFYGGATLVASAVEGRFSWSFVLGLLLVRVIVACVQGAAWLIKRLPREFSIGGGFRVLKYGTLQRSHLVFLPLWILRLGPNYSRARITSSGHCKVLWELSLDFGHRPGVIAEGETCWVHSWRITFTAPVRLFWRRNVDPSRSWTGRERELAKVEWWTPAGWRCHSFREPMRMAPIWGLPAYRTATRENAAAAKQGGRGWRGRRSDSGEASRPPAGGAK